MKQDLEELEELVKTAKKGDKLSTEIIIDRFTPFIVKKAQGIYIKGYDMDDLIQIGRISVINAINKYKQGSNRFVAYVTCAITSNYYYEIRKLSKYGYEASLDFQIGEGFTLADVIPENYDIEEEMASKDEIKNLEQAIKALSEDERQLIYDIYFRGKKLKDYAEAKNIKYEKCIRKKRKIINKLRKYMEVFL